MTINPWEATFDVLSDRYRRELQGKPRRAQKTVADLEKYFSTEHGKRDYAKAERYFVVKFVNGEVRVVQPYENMTFKSVRERTLALAKR